MGLPLSATRMETSERTERWTNALHSMTIREV